MTGQQKDSEVSCNPIASFSSFSLLVLFLLLLSSFSRGPGKGSAEVWHPWLSALGLDYRHLQDYARDTVLKICWVPRRE